MQINPDLLAYLQRKQWLYRPCSDGRNLAVKQCPFCGRAKWKFQVLAETTQYRCFHCNASGNLYKLKRELGDVGGGARGVVSAAKASGEVAAKPGKPIPLSVIESFHARLLRSKVGMAYCEQRGFDLATVKHFKLGLQIKHGVRWLVIPHLGGGVCHNVKFRSLPPEPKSFRRQKGAASVLFNADALAEHDSVVVAEAETDAMALWAAGVRNVVSLTCGAGTFLPEWYDAFADKSRVVLCLDADAVGQTGAREIARRLGFDRCENVLLPLHDANEVLTQMGAEELERAVQRTERFEVEGVLTLRNAITQCATHTELGGHGLMSPWRGVNRIMRKGWNPGDLVVLSAKVKTGKAVAHGQGVWTPQGLKAIETLHRGDSVFGVDGEPYSVTGVYPQGERDIYRVTFSDGVHLDVDGEHLWEVQAYNDGCTVKSTQVLTTDQLRAKGLMIRDKQWRFSIPMAEPLNFRPVLLPLDPYLLGVLIGDGGLTNSSLSVTNVDEGVVRRIARRLPSWMHLTTKPDGITYNLVNATPERYRLNPIRTALRELGLLGCRAECKFIPSRYLVGDVGQRVALLRGLMDTDGEVERKGQLAYGTVSPGLAADVRTLVESLGGRAFISTKPTAGQLFYQVRFSVGSDVSPFLHKRRRARYLLHCAQRTRARNHRSIVAIEPRGRQQATCIAVDAPRGLFVAQHGIVTHNTTFALAIAKHLAETGTPSLVYCLEMDPRRLAEKLVASQRRVPADDLTPIDFKLARFWLRRLPLYFIEPAWGADSLKPERVFDKVRETVKRHGVKFMVFDHLHFLCRSLQHLNNEIGQVTRGFKLLAEELGIVVMLVAQPKKVTSGKVITYDDIKDSASIPADADQVILLHRKPVPAATDDLDSSDDQEVLEPKTLVRFDAARFQAGGETWLHYAGDTATFVDWDDRPQVEAPKL